ncbi:DoxX family protein [Actinoallomurus acaciae]|uniref:DoxX family protein n=1 Tax=Actinoallomurus acaciae TaxID=502577 RepID=A0ABV5YT10_9ACTN
MSIAHIIITILAAAMVGFSAVSMFAGAAWVVRPLADYGVPDAWRPWLATAKAAGAAGLLAGLFVPAIGAVAGICLVLYFAGAVITVLRARWFSHTPFPLMYVAPVIGSLALGIAA